MVSFIRKTALSSETTVLKGLHKVGTVLGTALRRIRQLQLRDVPTVLCIAGLVVKFAVYVRRHSLTDLVIQFDAAEAPTFRSSEQLGRAVVLTRHIAHAIYGKACCLPRSLVLFYFYRRCGYPAVFYVGIGRQQGRLRSHAWVEGGVDGEEVVSGTEDGYNVVFRYPH